MRTSPLTIRPFTDEELPAAQQLLVMAFGEEPQDADLEAERSVFEADRSVGAFEGDQMVGCLGTYSFDMTVPGGSAPVAGTTWVSVSPTHRRRGVLSAMMDRHLLDIVDRGEPLAALWASEAAIYGRFGYGSSIEAQRLTVALEGDVAWEPTAPPAADRVRIVPLGEAREALDPLYEAVRRRRAGMHRRSEPWWGFSALSTREAARWGAPVKRVAVAEVDGHDAAYAIYGMKGDYLDTGRPAGTMRVLEIGGVDPAAEAAMWRFLVGHDLVTSLVARHRPIDDPLPMLLADTRRVQRRPGDALHVRIMDLAGALKARSYGESAGVTIEVRDRVLDGNDGTWRVEVAPEGASVEPAEGSEPDLRMDVRALGSLYMGDIGLRRLAAAGMVEVRNPTVAGAVDAAFASTEAGWVPEVW